MRSTIAGCRIEVLDSQACDAWLNWALGRAPSAPLQTTSCWLLAHCEDGVTWGRRDADRWQVGSTVFPDLCPSINAINLLELWIFGPDEELLIWRDDDGFHGRRLMDVAWDGEAPDRPYPEVRVLLGNRWIAAGPHQFTRVGDGRGCEQAVPLTCSPDRFDGDRWPLRLGLKHYFETDGRTGVVRIAATRLVDVFEEDRR